MESVITAFLSQPHSFIQVLILVGCLIFWENRRKREATDTVSKKDLETLVKNLGDHEKGCIEKSEKVIEKLSVLQTKISGLGIAFDRFQGALDRQSNRIDNLTVGNSRK